MKSIPAIVEPAHADVDLLAERLRVALRDERDAEENAARWEQQASAARETARMRRREIGEALIQARAAWPERGPRAKGWGEFLGRVGLEQSTAWRYMEAVRAPDFMQPHETPDPSPGDSQGASDGRESGGEDDLNDPTERANVAGGSGEVERGTWCTPKEVADDVGPWDPDPFTNPRSHVVAAVRCMLEDGGNGLVDPEEPGSYRSGRDGIRQVALRSDRVWIQPPYTIVDRAIAHYGHTRFCALLRFAPDTRWFQRLIAVSSVVAIPLGWRLDFEPPPGIPQSSNPYPHALYYRDERDVTEAVRAKFLVAIVDHSHARPTLRIVR